MSQPAAVENGSVMRRSCGSGGAGQEEAVWGAADGEGCDGAADRVEDGDFLGEAEGDPEAAVTGEVDAVGAAAELEGAAGGESCGVDHDGGAVDAVVDPEGAAVGRGEDLVAAFAGADAAEDGAVGGVDFGEVVAAHVGDEQLVGVPDDAGGGAADFCGPHRGHALEVEGGDAVGALEGDVGDAAVGGIGEVAGHLADGEALGELHGCGFVDVDLVAGEAGDDEPFAVGAEAELVGVGDGHAALDLGGGGIEEQHFVAAGVADQEFAAAGGEGDVVGFAEDGDAAEFGALCDVQQAEGGVAGVDDDCHAGWGGGGGSGGGAGEGQHWQGE